MVCRLVDFALVVLDLLIFKVCAIIGISKVGFFNFSCNEGVKSSITFLRPDKPEVYVL